MAGIERAQGERNLTEKQNELIISAMLREKAPGVSVSPGVSEKIRDKIQSELPELQRQRSGLVRFFQWLLHVRN